MSLQQPPDLEHVWKSGAGVEHRQASSMHCRCARWESFISFCALWVLWSLQTL